MIKQFHYVTLRRKKLFFDIIDSGWTARTLPGSGWQARSFPQIYFRTHVTWRLLLTFCLLPLPLSLCLVNEILIWLCWNFILQYWFYGKATSWEDERILCNWRMKTVAGFSVNLTPAVNGESSDNRIRFQGGKIKAYWCEFITRSTIWTSTRAFYYYFLLRSLHVWTVAFLSKSSRE